jgi:hypothetical protein
MRARDFCYWLQGFFELGGGDAAPFTAEQADVVRQHLRLVFEPRTPAAVEAARPTPPAILPLGGPTRVSGLDGLICAGHGGHVATCHAGDRAPASC